MKAKLVRFWTWSLQFVCERHNTTSNFNFYRIKKISTSLTVWYTFNSLFEIGGGHSWWNVVQAVPGHCTSSAHSIPWNQIFLNTLQGKRLWSPFICRRNEFISTRGMNSYSRKIGMRKSAMKISFWDHLFLLSSRKCAGNSGLFHQHSMTRQKLGCVQIWCQRHW